MASFVDQLNSYGTRPGAATVMDDHWLWSLENQIRFECQKRAQRFETRRVWGYVAVQNDGDGSRDIVLKEALPQKISHRDILNSRIEPDRHFGQTGLSFYSGTASLYHRSSTNYQWQVSEAAKRKLYDKIRSLGFTNFELKVINIEETNETFSKGVLGKKVEYTPTGNIFQAVYIDIRW